MGKLVALKHDAVLDAMRVQDLSKWKLSLVSRLDIATVRRWFNGRTAKVRWENVELVAGILKVEPQSLVL